MSETPVVYQPESQELFPVAVMSTALALSRLREFQDFVRAVMHRDEDYGVIPGTDKPTLLKPGAEKLCELYGFAPTLPEITHRVEDWQNGFFHYEVKVRLISKRNGSVVAEGVGSCNSKESRYARRWVFGSQIPQGIEKSKLQTRQRTGKNGKPYTQYLLTNDDPFSQVNTILKMAKKRALIDATLTATRSSGMFTQDIEDWAEGDYREEEPPGERQAEPGKPVSPPLPTVGAQGEMVSGPPSPAELAQQEHDKLLAHYKELVEALPLAGLAPPGPLPSPISNKALREINERLSNSLARKHGNTDLEAANAEAEQMALASDAAPGDIPPVHAQPIGTEFMP